MKVKCHKHQQDHITTTNHPNDFGNIDNVSQTEAQDDMIFIIDKIEAFTPMLKHLGVGLMIFHGNFIEHVFCRVRELFYNFYTGSVVQHLIIH